MNLELLDPFGQYFPQTVFERLANEESATTTTCAFNRRANLVAAGTRDGRCLIWDLDTRNIVLRLKGHAQPITSRGVRRHTFKFEAPVIETRMHPRNKPAFVAIVNSDPPYLIKYASMSHQRIQLELSDHSEAQAALPEPNAKNLQAQIEYAVCAIFSPDGLLILIGTTKGNVVVFDSETGQRLSILRVGASQIKHICCSKSGRDLLVNSTDRIIRSFRLEKSNGSFSLTPQKQFQDAVDRNQWSQCCYSADGEMVVGALASNQKHNIYIWDKNMGNLVKLLEGPREGMADMVWHPSRPIIASVSHFGAIYFWGVVYTQNFSAFAPFFTELEDNREYRE
eukprot:jgi/Hompol1/2822/HPOL_005647-RA